MNLEELLRQEMQGAAPNPMLGRTDEIVSRVRHRRRLRAVAASVVSVGVLAVVAVLASRFLLVAPTGAPPASPPRSAAVPLSQILDGSMLAPGRYIVSVESAPFAPLLPVLSVPDGYVGINDGSAVIAGDDGAGDGRYVWAWWVGAVYPDPCAAGVYGEVVGPTVADLANALATQQGRAGTNPTPVTIGGYDGMYVELTVPEDTAVGDCPNGRFNMWPGRWQEEAGQVDMVWIVDVDGQRIVLDASHGADASAVEVAELRVMVTGATFEPAEGD